MTWTHNPLSSISQCRNYRHALPHSILFSVGVQFLPRWKHYLGLATSLSQMTKLLKVILHVLRFRALNPGGGMDCLIGLACYLLSSTLNIIFSITMSFQNQKIPVLVCVTLHQDSSSPHALWLHHESRWPILFALVWFYIALAFILSSLLVLKCCLPCFMRLFHSPRAV